MNARRTRTWFFVVLWLGLAGAAPDALGADRKLGELAYSAGDYRTALGEWRPLAESGDAVAQYYLGLLSENGSGVARDRNAAADWYRRAAEQELPDAQFALGDLYFVGLEGTPDPEQAAEWYRRAADQDFEDAIAALEHLEPASNAPAAPGGFDETGGDTAYSLIESSGRCAKVDGRPFSIDVVVEIPPAPIDHSRSIAELNPNNPHGAMQAIGLAASDITAQSSGKYGFRDNGDHKCFWVEHVEVRVVYRSMQIFIASEYKKGSCPYAKILRHEREHVTIARRNLTRFEPRIRSALASLSVPKAGQPIRIGPNDNPRAELSRLFNKLVAPVLEDMMADLSASQAKIDTPKSYAKVRRGCRESSW